MKLKKTENCGEGGGMQDQIGKLKLGMPLIFHLAIIIQQKNLRFCNPLDKVILLLTGYMLRSIS